MVRLLGVFGLVGGELTAAEPLRVAAASSLAAAMKQINAVFTSKTGREVTLTLGASNLLARQIVAGAPIDVFISADGAAMDVVAAKGMVVPGTREDQLSNTLVVIVPSDSALRLSSLQDLRGSSIARIVTGHPKAVPVGVYARQYLEQAGMWEALAPKILAVDTARAALAVVESGHADAGIVYRTDATISKKVRVALELPAGEGPKITYPMAMMKEAAEPALASQYLDFLDTEPSTLVFEKFGFIVLPEAGRDR